MEMHRLREKTTLYQLIKGAWFALILKIILKTRTHCLRMIRVRTTCLGFKIQLLLIQLERKPKCPRLKPNLTSRLTLPSTPVDKIARQEVITIVDNLKIINPHKYSRKKLLLKRKRLAM